MKYFWGLDMGQVLAKQGLGVSFGAFGGSKYLK
jgi:hypothetical protein